MGNVLSTLRHFDAPTARLFEIQELDWNSDYDIWCWSTNYWAADGEEIPKQTAEVVHGANEQTMRLGGHARQHRFG